MGFKFPHASDTVVAETDMGKSPSAGKLRSYSRGDHTHGTPTNIPILTNPSAISLRQNIEPYYGTLSIGSPTLPLLSIYAQSMYQTVCYANAILSTAVGNDLAIRTQSSSVRSVFIQSWDTALRTVLQAINGRADIPRAGDISLLDDRYLGIGKVTALPTPSAAYRGKMVYLDYNYSASTDDELYICLWRDALGAFSWIRLA